MSIPAPIPSPLPLPKVPENHHPTEMPDNAFGQSEPGNAENYDGLPRQPPSSGEAFRDNQLQTPVYQDADNTESHVVHALNNKTTHFIDGPFAGVSVPDNNQQNHEIGQEFYVDSYQDYYEQFEEISPLSTFEQHPPVPPLPVPSLVPAPSIPKKIDLSEMSNFFDDGDASLNAKPSTPKPKPTQRTTVQDLEGGMDLNLLSDLLKDTEKDAGSTDKEMIDKLLKMLLERQPSSVPGPREQSNDSDLPQSHASDSSEKTPKPRHSTQSPKTDVDVTPGLSVETVNSSTTPSLTSKRKTQ
jgi:hypothetical protein